MTRLFNCKDCDKEISPSAKACPNCGRKVKLEDIPFSKMDIGQKTSIVFASLFSLFILYIFISLLFSTSDKNENDKILNDLLAAQQSASSAYILKNEKQFVNSGWFTNTTLSLGVRDNGTERDFLAARACVLLKEHGYPYSNVSIKIIDAVEAYNKDNWIFLGRNECNDIPKK